MPGDELELLSFRAVARLLHRHHGRVTEMVRTRQLLSVQDDRGRVFVPRWAVRRWQEQLAGLVALAAEPPPTPEAGPARRRRARPSGRAPRAATVGREPRLLTIVPRRT